MSGATRSNLPASPLPSGIGPAESSASAARLRNAVPAAKKSRRLISHIVPPLRFFGKCWLCEFRQDYKLACSGLQLKKYAQILASATIDQTVASFEAPAAKKKFDSCSPTHLTRVFREATQ